MDERSVLSLARFPRLRADIGADKATVTKARRQLSLG